MAIFEPNNRSLDHSFFFSSELPDLGPIDFCPIQYVQTAGLINLNFVRQIRATDEGSVFSVSVLDVVDSFPDIAVCKVHLGDSLGAGFGGPLRCGGITFSFVTGGIFDWYSSGVSMISGIGMLVCVQCWCVHGIVFKLDGAVVSFEAVLALGERS